MDKGDAALNPALDAYAPAEIAARVETAGTAKARLPLLPLLTLAVLAFYAFIGFEDMVNVAEEVTANLTLTLFAVVNLALLVLKRRDPRPEGVSLTPAWVPMLGFLSSGALAALAVAGLY